MSFNNIDNIKDTVENAVEETGIRGGRESDMKEDISQLRTMLEKLLAEKRSD